MPASPCETVERIYQAFANRYRIAHVRELHDRRAARFKPHMEPSMETARAVETLG